MNTLCGVFFAFTNSVPYSWTLAVGAACATNLNNNVVVAGFPGVNPKQLWSVYVLVTNPSPTTDAIPCLGGALGQGQGTAPIHYLTNSIETEFPANRWGALTTTDSRLPHG